MNLCFPLPFILHTTHYQYSYYTIHTINIHTTHYTTVNTNQRIVLWLFSLYYCFIFYELHIAKEEWYPLLLWMTSYVVSLVIYESIDLPKMKDWILSIDRIPWSTSATLWINPFSPRWPYEHTPTSLTLPLYFPYTHHPPPNTPIHYTPIHNTRNLSHPHPNSPQSVGLKGLKECGILG